MASFSTFPTLFSILLIFTTIAARPDPQDYWKSVTKNQPMPEALQGLIHPEAGREGHFVKNLRNDENFPLYAYYKGMSHQENGNENQYIVDSVSARQDPQGYWKSVTKNQPMPEALQGLIHPEAGREGHFVKNLKNDQNPLFYGYYKGMSGQETGNENHFGKDELKEEKSFNDNSENEESNNKSTKGEQIEMVTST